MSITACHRQYSLAVMLIAGLAVAAVTSTAARPAMESSLMQDLHIIQSQIELYKLHHGGRCPKIHDNDLPQLTDSTNVRGEIGPPGSNFPLGPYFFGRLPLNRMDGSRHLSPVARPGQSPTEAVGALGGWQYDEAIGTIWPNNPGFY